MRKLAFVASLAVLVVAIAAPASATKPDPDSGLDDGHKIWICHATRSLSNPYVKIHIDIAAWDIEDPDSNDHGPAHHAREKDGITWADYALEFPTDECSIEEPPPPPPPPNGVCSWTEDPVDYEATFDGTKLVFFWNADRAVLTTSKPIDIPAGTYEVVLISGDFDRTGGSSTPIYQPNEQWRLLGDDNSEYSADLVDTVGDVSGITSNGGQVTFDSDVTSVTAEHWAVGMGGATGHNSVTPQAACLTEVRDDDPVD